MAARARAFKVAFKCTGCGRCCTGQGGIAWVNGREIAAMAEHLALPKATFAKQYLRTVNGATALRQTDDDRQCIFLDGKQCSVYPARPTQCRTYPFWPQQLISKYDWTLAAKECEGILLDAPPPETITPDAHILKEVVIHEVHRSGEELTYDDINDLVSELEPEMLDAFQEEVDAKYQRSILHEDDDILVMDSFLDGLPPTRSLHFVDRLELVQSEVLLNEDGSINDTELALDVHKGLCVGLTLLRTERLHNLRIGLLGAGRGGSFRTFLTSTCAA
ncbi:hypothetical protein SPRG_17426, partial [Saprolegnia parasitica CBS 223.65]